MAQIVPLQAVASQSLSIVLNNQQCSINVYSLNTPGDILKYPLPSTELQGYAALYVDLAVNGTTVFTTKLASNLIPLLLTSQYFGFEGELVFVDTQNVGLQNGTNPIWTGLGSQYQLVYLAPSDLT